MMSGIETVQKTMAVIEEDFGTKIAIQTAWSTKTATYIV